MVEVGRFQNRTHAELARSLLAASGIPCVLVPAEAGGFLTMDLSVGARLLVAEADADDAALVLRRHGATEAEER